LLTIFLNKYFRLFIIGIICTIYLFYSTLLLFKFITL
jgi:hypothetical protein